MRCRQAVLCTLVCAAAHAAAAQKPQTKFFSKSKTDGEQISLGAAPSYAPLQIDISIFGYDTYHGMRVEIVADHIGPSHSQQPCRCFCCCCRCSPANANLFVPPAPPLCFRGASTVAHIKPIATCVAVRGACAVVRVLWCVCCPRCLARGALGLAGQGKQQDRVTAFIKENQASGADKTKHLSIIYRRDPVAGRIFYYLQVRARWLPGCSKALASTPTPAPLCAAQCLPLASRHTMALPCARMGVLQWPVRRCHLLTLGTATAFKPASTRTTRLYSRSPAATTTTTSTQQAPAHPADVSLTHTHPVGTTQARCPGGSIHTLANGGGGATARWRAAALAGRRLGGCRACAPPAQLAGGAL